MRIETPSCICQEQEGFLLLLLTAKFIVGAQRVHHRLGDFLDHAQFIVIAGIHDLLNIPFKLRPGINNAVLEQIVHRNSQGIGDVDQRGQADPGAPGLYVAHMGRR